MSRLILQHVQVEESETDDLPRPEPRHRFTPSPSSVHWSEDDEYVPAHKAADTDA